MWIYQARRDPISLLAMGFIHSHNTLDSTFIFKRIFPRLFHYHRTVFRYLSKNYSFFKIQILMGITFTHTYAYVLLNIHAKNLSTNHSLWLWLSLEIPTFNFLFLLLTYCFHFLLLPLTLKQLAWKYIYRRLYACEVVYYGTHMSRHVRGYWTHYFLCDW